MIERTHSTKPWCIPTCGSFHTAVMSSPVTKQPQTQSPRIRELFVYMRSYARKYECTTGRILFAPVSPACGMVKPTPPRITSSPLTLLMLKRKTSASSAALSEVLSASQERITYNIQDQQQVEARVGPCYERHRELSLYLQW